MRERHRHEASAGGRTGQRGALGTSRNSGSVPGHVDSSVETCGSRPLRVAPSQVARLSLLSPCALASALARYGDLQPGDACARVLFPTRIRRSSSAGATSALHVSNAAQLLSRLPFWPRTQELRGHRRVRQSDVDAPGVEYPRASWRFVSRRTSRARVPGCAAAVARWRRMSSPPAYWSSWRRL